MTRSLTPTKRYAGLVATSPQRSCKTYLNKLKWSWQTVTFTYSSDLHRQNLLNLYWIFLSICELFSPTFCRCCVLHTLTSTICTIYYEFRADAEWIGVNWIQPVMPVPSIGTNNICSKVWFMCFVLGAETPLAYALVIDENMQQWHANLMEWKGRDWKDPMVMTSIHAQFYLDISSSWGNS